MVSEKVKFIEDLTKGISHGKSSRPFFDHLNSTSKIMKGLFPQNQYLSDAALFHSVYGTSYFEFESDITREQVISLIGTEAEKLVYLFCSLENRTLQILQHKFEPELQKDLYKLEYANLLEDTSYRSKTSQSISPLMVFILNLIRSNLKDHYSIPLPPIPFQPIIVE